MRRLLLLTYSITRISRLNDRKLVLVTIPVTHTAQQNPLLPCWMCRKLCTQSTSPKQPPRSTTRASFLTLLTNMGVTLVVHPTSGGPRPPGGRAGGAEGTARL